MNRRSIIPLFLALILALLGEFVVTARTSSQQSGNSGELLQRERVGALLQFVEHYYQYETEGGRLTDEGWAAAASFFLHPIPPPRVRKITVVGDYGVGGGAVPVIKPADLPAPDLRATAQVDVFTTSAVGTIDSSLRFTADRTLGFEEIDDLVLTDKRPAWKFKEEPSSVMIGLPTAILYVSLMREKTTDPAIRKNADDTLAALRKVPAY